MHVCFIAYGKRDQVELMLRDMEAQKHKLTLTKGKKKKLLWIQGQVRTLPFGVYEYVFPKEDLNLVLNTLKLKSERYKLNRLPFGMIRKFLRLKPIPKYDEKNAYLWIKDHVNLFPIGIREDYVITDSYGEHEGWTHEAI